jgi:hypothetical protein
MAKNKPVPRNRGMKPNLAVADTSGSNLSDFKNAVSKAAKVVGAGNKALSGFTRELTGAGAIDRAIDNPSKKSVASAALGVGLAALPFIKLGKAASAANTASQNAVRNAIAASQPTVQSARAGTSVTNSMRLKDGLGSLYSGSNVSQIVGSKVTTVGPKNVNAVIRGVELNARNQGARAAANSMTGSMGVVKGLAVGPVANALNNTLNSSSKKVEKSSYTGLPQDKGGKNKPGYKSNYKNTPSPSKSTQSSFGTLVTPSVPKKKNKGKSNGGGSKSYGGGSTSYAD